MPNKPLALVSWNDAHSPGATTVVSEGEMHSVHAPLLIITAGWILRKDQEGISIAAEYCGDGEWRGVTFIPASLIQDVTLLGVRRKRNGKAQDAHRGPGDRVRHDESNELSGAPQDRA